LDQRSNHPRRPAAAALAASDTAQRLRWILAFIALAALTLAAAVVQARPAPDSFADLAEKLLPGVVNVSTTQTVKDEATTGDQDLDQFFKDFFDRQRKNNPQRKMTSLGSGFIIDPAGYIVTNNHVIAEADEVTVRLTDNTELKATIIGRDEKTDLALLKVDSKEPLTALSWGDSDAMRIGDWVLAIGNPFGLGGTVTAGIVSARNRILEGGGPYDDYIQTDASINRGNSGGPLFNTAGEVIGINTAIYSNNSGGSVGIGFAIPSSLAKNVIAQIRQFGKPRRGWLGVRIQTVNDELAEGLHLQQTKGALVANVTDGGPADKAGIKQGDVILTFDGKEVNEMRTLPRMVAETPINKKVPVLVSRQGKQMTFDVVLGELTEEAEQASVQTTPTPESAPPTKEGKIASLGLTLSEITAPLRDKFSLDQDAKGVVVTDVEDQGSAAEKGLHAGDVIVEVDQQAVSTPGDVDKRVKDAKDHGYRVVTLLVYRDGDYQWVALRIDRS
jgi:serine protease Do